MMNIVIDTNVILSALTSRQGASFKLLTLIGTESFEISISVPLVLEYEDVVKRQVGTRVALSAKEVDDVIDYLCAVGIHHQIYYLWRPLLKDPRDDMVLELAVSAGCDAILTYNLRDFQGAEQFGIRVITPKTFLEQLGVL